MSTLVFGKTYVVQDHKVVTSSGTGWNYDPATNTLHITENVTISGAAAKLIGSAGDLHITVGSGATLTVESTSGENTRYAIYADGNITLDGAGTINITHEDQRNGIRAQQGITIRKITVNLLSGGSSPEIRANGGALVIEDAVVTAKGLCMAWNNSKDYYPIRILGRSVVDIDSTNASGALRGGEYEFSDCAHVKVRDDKKVIGGANLAFELAAGQTKNYYFRANDGDSFTKGEMIRTNRDVYFEYIGANHVDETTIKSDGEATHTMNCQCKGEGKTAITVGCSGGTATCTTQAKCEVCGQSYGDTVLHQYNKYHVCEVCKGLEANADVVVAVVAGSEKRGYTSGEMGNAIAFVGKYPGAVLTIIDPARECLDKLKVNNPDADFTIDLAGTNNKSDGIVTVSGGKVTIRDSKTGGTFYHITTQGTGNVTLESGTIKSGAEVTNGTFNVAGGTISRIDLTDGQLNWNSSTAEGTNINYRGQGKVTVNAVPKSTLSILLPITQDLSQPVAVLGNGVSLTENMLAIKMGNSYMTPYMLKPVAQGNQIYAHLSLSQLGAEDIVLKQVSGFTYDGTEQKPSVTVRRYVKPDSYGTGMEKGDLTGETDYTVTYKDNVNAGTATVTITGIGCYTDSIVRTFTIAKAAPKQSVVDADSCTYSCRVDNADRVDLTAYLPKDHGGITAATAAADGTLTYSSAPSVADGVLSYTIQQSTKAASGEIHVTVSTVNYEDITIAIPLKMDDIGILKLKEGSAVTLQNATLTEGEKLSALKFNDAVFVDETGKEVKGTLVFRTPDAAPAVGPADVEWVFRPDNGTTYMEMSGMVSVMVKAKPTSGGGAAAPSTTPTASDVVTVKDDKSNAISGNNAATTTKTTVNNTKNETSRNEQGQTVSKITGTLSKETAEKLVDQAVSNKSDTIEITVSSTAVSSGTADTAKSTELEIPKATIDTIAKETNADLVVKTDSGSVTLDNKTLKTITSETNGDTVKLIVKENAALTEAQQTASAAITENGKLFDLAAQIGNRLLHDFQGGKAYVTLPMPQKLKGKDVLVVYINESGLCEALNHSVEKIGADEYISFTTTHFSTFAIAEKAEAEKLIAAQSADQVKERMQSAAFKVTTSRTSKKSVKVQIAAKSDKTLLADIKNMGYTVKYQCYRSTKKDAGYKLRKTSSKNSFISTKGTKGKKYYYKARVLVYDGSELVARSTFKQCSYGARTWTK